MRQRSPWRFAWAPATVALALGIRLLLQPVLGASIPYATFYAAVALSAVLGGLGSGVLAILLGALVSLYYIIPPYRTFSLPGPDKELGMALYLVVSSILLILSERQTRARLRAERSETAEKGLRQRVETILASIGDGVIAADTEGRVTLLNRAASSLTGWKCEEAVGRPVEDVFVIRNEETGATVENPVRRAIREGTVVGLANHTVLLSRDGRRIAIADTGAPIVDSGGGTQGAVLVFHDVTEARRQEAELRRRTQMIDLSHDAIIQTDAARRIVSWNTGARETYGWEESEVLGRITHELLQTRNDESAADIDEALRRNGRWDGELIQKRKDGTQVISESRHVVLRDALGDVSGFLEINRDATERKRIEQKLREAAKLESLGVLAGGIAHDFNNLLTGVMGNATVIQESLPPGSTEARCAGQIVLACERAATLTRQMLAYSGKGRFVIQRVNVSNYIRDTVELMRASIPKNVELRLELRRDIPTVEADAAQLQQLVMNLVLNGAEAIPPEGGRVSVVTHSESVDEAYIRTLNIHDHMRPGVYVVIEVQDTGQGMDESTLARIFEPFFTTKFVGRGLGLAAVFGIVRGHKGGMKVYSAPGAGTCFRVLLPAAPAAPAPVSEAPSAERPLRKGTGTVLVVDDEDIVRATTKAALEKLGYRVLLASSGEEAVDVLRTAASGIALVILDLTMPGISGNQFLRELKEIRSDLPVVLTSGFSEADAMQRFAGQRLAGFLQKPYTVRKLSEVVHSACGSADLGSPAVPPQTEVPPEPECPV